VKLFPEEEEEEEKELEERIRMRICTKYNSSNTYTRFGSIYAPPYLAKPDKRGTTGRLAFHTRSLVVYTRQTHGQ
jgi:hypothetical protein